MARYRHVTTGAVVDVREDKALGSEWEPIVAKASAPKAPARPAAKSAGKSADK